MAIQRELDLFGVLFLGAVTAIGGGVIRDLLLGQTPPQVFVNYIYLAVAVVTALTVFLWSAYHQRQEYRKRRYADTLLNFFDAAGLGIFSVIGVQNTVNAGFGDNAFFCVFLGMTTGVGGGMLRDMMSRETPVVLRKHIYALASAQRPAHRVRGHCNAAGHCGTLAGGAVPVAAPEDSPIGDEVSCA